MDHGLLVRLAGVEPATYRLGASIEAPLLLGFPDLWTVMWTVQKALPLI